MLRNYLQALLDHLAPCHCQLCGQPSARPLALCEACQATLATNTNACPICALPIPVDATTPCGQCQLKSPSFTSAIAPYLYTRPVDGFIRRLKFSGDQVQIPVLAELMSQPLARALQRTGRPDLVLPVPLHWRRRWQRGFNQASLLARQLCNHPVIAHWNLQVDDRLGKRRVATTAQHGLDRDQRLRNIRRAFVCAEVPGQHILVVDDVMTTGATVEALARELLDRGARRVDICCCARTPQPG